MKVQSRSVGMPASWKSVWDNIAMTYSATSPEGEAQPNKTGK